MISREWDDLLTFCSQYFRLNVSDFKIVLCYNVSVKFYVIISFYVVINETI